MDVHLRHATLADMELLRRWEAAPHVRAAYGADGGYDWEAELAGVVPWQEFLVAAVDGRPVGFVEIIDPARDVRRYWGEVEPGLRALDIWLGEAGDLGRGYGTAIMQAALARCFAPAEVHAVVIDPLAANTRAIRFYERLGFRAVERRRFGDDDCLVMRLERPAEV